MAENNKNINDKIKISDMHNRIGDISELNDLTTQGDQRIKAKQIKNMIITTDKIKKINNLKPEVIAKINEPKVEPSNATIVSPPAPGIIVNVNLEGSQKEIEVKKKGQHIDWFSYKTKDSKFKCPFCDKVYDTTQAASNHVWYEHNSGKLAIKKKSEAKQTPPLQEEKQKTLPKSLQVEPEKPTLDKVSFDIYQYLHECPLEAIEIMDGEKLRTILLQQKFREKEAKISPVVKTKDKKKSEVEGN